MKFIILLTLSSILLSEEKYKEPQFILLDRKDNIEIREYGNYIVAKTSIPLESAKTENNMFRVLASYIFGDNQKNKKIPMTAPVTTLENNNSYEMIFYMLESENIEDLPLPNAQDIIFETMSLGKCAVINFSWFVNDNRINKYQKQLEQFLEKNGYKTQSPFMVNRYDPPWRLPFMRRNEVLVKID